MRTRQTFLLTILTPDDGPESLCGRLKVIASGKTYTFTSLDELYRLISLEMGEDVSQSFNPLDLSQGRQNGHAAAD
jgi:hypothetical protein